MFVKVFVVSTIFSVSNCWFADSKGSTSGGRDTSFDKDMSSNNNTFKKHKNSILCADLGDNIHQKLIFNKEGNVVDVVLQKATAKRTSFVVHSRKTVTYLNTLERITIEGLTNERFSGKVVIDRFNNTIKGALEVDKSSIRFTTEGCSFIKFVPADKGKELLKAWSLVKLSPTCLFYKEIRLVQFNQQRDGKLFIKFNNQDVDVTGDVPLIEKKIKNALKCNDLFSSLSQEGIKTLKYHFHRLDGNGDNQLSSQEISGMPGLILYLFGDKYAINVSRDDFRDFKGHIDLHDFALVIIRKKYW